MFWREFPEDGHTGKKAYTIYTLYFSGECRIREGRASAIGSKTANARAQRAGYEVRAISDSNSDYKRQASLQGMYRLSCAEGQQVPCVSVRPDWYRAVRNGSE